MQVADFKRLQAWEKAHSLALAVYAATAEFPATERFGLVLQMRRAALSIPTNIAEACGRTRGADRARFFQFAKGSAKELEYQLLFARDAGAIAPAVHDRLSEKTVEVQRMLSGLLRHVRNPISPA